jgi:uncharacterized repeat protein (TIGR01451 family)
MVRRTIAVAFAFALACVAAGGAPATGPATSAAAVVVRVVAADTLEVRRPGGPREPVRLLGVDAPAGSECFGAAATARARSLAGGRRVRLVSPQRDRRGRLSAYIILRGGGDLGRLLLERGMAQIDAWGGPFSRFPSYVPLQRKAELAARGLWGGCSADLDVAVSASAAVAVVGEELTYTVFVTNAGPRAAPAVAVDLRPPPSAEVVAGRSEDGSCSTARWHGSCSFRSIADGGRALATFVVRPARAGTLSTRVSVRFAWCVRSPCGRRPLRDPNVRNDESAALTPVLAVRPPPPPPGAPPAPAGTCHRSYPDVCIPPPPPDLDCADIPYRNFSVLRDPPDPDPHILDRNEDGVACQFDDY